MKGINRRGFLKTMGVSSIAMVGGNELLAKESLAADMPLPVQEDEKGFIDYLRIIRPDFEMGVFHSDITNPDTIKVLRKNFNAVTVGIYMQSTQRIEGEFSLDRASMLIEFYRLCNLTVKLHPLLGPAEYIPPWAMKEPYAGNPDKIRELMETRIKTIMGKYRGKIQYIDVFNEVISGSQSYYQLSNSRGPNIWIDLGMIDNPVPESQIVSLGDRRITPPALPVVIKDGFELTRKYGGDDLVLIYNEAPSGQVESVVGERTYELIKLMLKHNVPVNAVGMQMHMEIDKGEIYEGFNQLPYNGDRFSKNMQRYADLGLKIFVSEFDINLPKEPSPKDFRLQAEVYKDVLRRCLEQPACVSFITWGLDDSRAWVPNWRGFNGQPLWFDANLKPKLAYTEVLAMLKEMAETMAGLKDYTTDMLMGAAAFGDIKGKNTQVLLKEFNAIQPTCYPFRGWKDRYSYDFDAFNKWVNWGVEHGKKVIMHMITGPTQYFSDWIKTSVWDKDELDAMFHAYIKSMLTSNDNGKKVYAWNVVNEALQFNNSGRYHEDDKCFMNILGYEEDMSGLTGEDKINDMHPVYVRKAFEYADKYAEGKLELRETGFEFAPDSKKTKAIYQLIMHLRAKGVRVDALGLQCHLYNKKEDTYDHSKLIEVCEKFKNIGEIELFVTEADIGSFNDFELQKQRYKELIIASRQAGIAQFHFWGVADNKNSNWRGEDFPLIFDENLEKKPAYFGVLEGLLNLKKIKNHD